MATRKTPATKAIKAPALPYPNTELGRSLALTQFRRTQAALMRANSALHSVEEAINEHKALCRAELSKISGRLFTHHRILAEAAVNNLPCSPWYNLPFGRVNTILNELTPSTAMPFTISLEHLGELWDIHDEANEYRLKCMADHAKSDKDLTLMGVDFRSVNC